MVQHYIPPNPQERSLQKFLTSLIIVVLLFGALPVGVYLTQQQTYFTPQAEESNDDASIGTGLLLAERKDANLSPSEKIVQILASAEGTPVNLFNVRLNYPSDLEVVNIATSSAEIREGEVFFAPHWFEVVNDPAGLISLIAGVEKTGLKTDETMRHVLAEIHLKAKNPGVKEISIDGLTSALDKDGNPVLDRREGISLNFSQSAPSSSPSIRARTVTNAPLIQLISPKGGEVFSDSSAIPVEFVADNLKNINVSLYLNDQYLGRIASLSATTTGKFDFDPYQVLLPSFINNINTFKVELVGESTTGEFVSDINSVPFGIINKEGFTPILTTSNSLLVGRGDANNDGVVTLTDLSIILSRFGEENNLDGKVDINADGVINSIDLWLMKQILMSQGVLRSL